MTKFNPEIWLESTTRVLKEYVEANVNTGIYQVVMEFPGPMVDSMTPPLKKSIFHFEVDGIPERPLGFGDNMALLNYDADTQTTNPQEAREVRLDFDVGIWTSDASGGTTSRMRMRQLLLYLFGGSQAYDRLKAFSDGGDGYLEILRFGGGSFTTDSINDERLFRMIDCSLEIRVFSRTRLSNAPGPAIEELSQAPNLTILG